MSYLNYLHTVDAYWKELSDGKQGTLDVHLDKFELSVNPQMSKKKWQ